MCLCADLQMSRWTTKAARACTFRAPRSLKNAHQLTLTMAELEVWHQT